MSGHKSFSTLVAKMPRASQDRVAEKAQVLRREMALRELRTALELSQEQLAEILKVDQGAISRLERKTDMMLHTLRRFVEAMGGTLELHARFPEGDVKIAGLGDIREPDKTAARADDPATP